MKTINKYLLVIPLSLFSIQAMAQAKPETELEKLSYSMGFFIGKTVSQRNTDINIPVFIQAIEDVLKKNKPKMGVPEMQQTLVSFRQKELKTRAKINKAEGEKFMADNKSKDGVIELDDGLQYKVIRKGNGTIPTADDTVVVHYRGTLLDGTEFDSSYARGKPTELNVNMFIKGWQEALQLMPVGSKWQVTVPSDLAYGENGAGDVIGPNATLLFDIELISIK